MPKSSDVAETWIDRTASSPIEDQVLAESFWEILGGHPVPTDRLRTALALPLDVVEDALVALQARTNFFCSRGHAEAWQRERATLPGAVDSPSDAAGVGREI